MIITNRQAGSSCVVTLAKVRLGAAVLLEVTIVQYQRGLVFCGTSQGKYIVLYCTVRTSLLLLITTLTVIEDYLLVHGNVLASITILVNKNLMPTTGLARTEY